MATLITTLIPSGGLVMQLLIVASFNNSFQGINGLGFRVRVWICVFIHGDGWMLLHSYQGIYFIHRV